MRSWKLARGNWQTASGIDVAMNDAPAPLLPDPKARAEYYRGRAHEVRKRALVSSSPGRDRSRNHLSNPRLFSHPSDPPRNMFLLEEMVGAAELRVQARNGW